MEQRFNNLDNKEEKNSFGGMNYDNFNQQNSFSQNISSFEHDSVPTINGNQELPNAQGAYVLGIISIVLSLCTGLGFFTAIVGLFLGIGAENEAKLNPGKYTEASIKTAKTGKIMSIVILCYSGFTILALILFLVLGNLSI